MLISFCLLRNSKEKPPKSADLSHFDTFVFIMLLAFPLDPQQPPSPHVLQYVCDNECDDKHTYTHNLQITNPKYIIHYPDSHHIHGLISTSIGLNMRISPQYFENNMMSIKCVASISPVIWSGNKETIIQQGLQQFEIPLPSIDTREAMFLGETNE